MLWGVARHVMLLPGATLASMDDPEPDRPGDPLADRRLPDGISPVFFSTLTLTCPDDTSRSSSCWHHPSSPLTGSHVHATNQNLSDRASIRTYMGALISRAVPMPCLARQHGATGHYVRPSAQRLALVFPATRLMHVQPSTRCPWPSPSGLLAMPRFPSHLTANALSRKTAAQGHCLTLR